MPSETPNVEEITEARRRAIVKSIRSISYEELKALGETLFPFFDHPWREKYFAFINENAPATFHHAVTDDGIQFVYCYAKNKGIWFVEGSGKGTMWPKGLEVFRQIIEGLH